MTPKVVAGLLPHGPMPPPPDYAGVAPEPAHAPDAARPDATIDEAIDAWYSLVRQEFATIVGPSVHFQPRFVMRRAVGPRAAHHAGDSPFANALRVLAQLSREIALRVERRGSPAQCPSDDSVVARLVARAVRTTVRDDGSGDRQTLDAARAALFRWRALPSPRALRSLANACVAKAESREKTTARASMRKWRELLGATSTRNSDFAPTRFAYRWIKGIDGWKRSPIGTSAQNASSQADAGSDAIDDDDADAVDDPFEDPSLALNDCATVPLCDQAAVDAEADGWGGSG